MATNLKLVSLTVILLSLCLVGCGAGIKPGVTYFDADGNSVIFENGTARYSVCGSVMFPYSDKAGKTVVDWSGCKPGSQCAQMGCNAEDETFTGDADTIVDQQGRQYYRYGSPGFYKFRDQMKAKQDAREQRMQDARKRYHELMKQSPQNQ